MQINTTKLAAAIRDHAAQQFDEAENDPDALEYSGRWDRYELLQVLARMVDGKPMNQAFGAPGDWGYDTDIGQALAGR